MAHLVAPEERQLHHRQPSILRQQREDVAAVGAEVLVRADGLLVLVLVLRRLAYRHEHLAHLEEHLAKLFDVHRRRLGLLRRSLGLGGGFGGGLGLGGGRLGGRCFLLNHLLRLCSRGGRLGRRTLGRH